MAESDQGSMEAKIKHLEFIQGVINRLSTNSFLLKGWSVVLVSALFALSASDSNVMFVYLAYIPACVFWGLDGYFLGLEKGYRKLYDRVREQEPEKVDFAMKISNDDRGFGKWVDATLSKSLIPFHGALISAIKKWIAGQLSGKSCAVILADTNTADRKWINYEIKEAWNAGKGVVAIHIHGLRNFDKKVSTKGKNPISFITHGPTGKKLSSIAKCYDPDGSNSKERYAWIKKHLANAVEEAIKIRNAND